MGEFAATDAQRVEFEFDNATKSTCIGTSADGRIYYAGEASNKWCIGEVPHGGYVLALITGAVLDYFSTKHQRDPVALNCFYLRKTEVGPFVVEIEHMKMSAKGYCLVRARLLQAKDAVRPTDVGQFDSRQYIEKVHAIFTMGNMAEEAGVTHLHEPYQAPNPSKMVPFQSAFMGEFLDCMVDPSTLHDFPNGMGKPVFDQLLQFSDGRDIDFKSIPYWCDMFVSPPLLLGQDFLGVIWCPTMQLEVQFKRKPRGKKVLTSIVAPHIINGRFDCSGGVWDVDGNLLALTRHQCLIVPWSRNSKQPSRFKSNL
ncbi:thioesterase-like superfamily-domain-containing protein [Dichotomocladium elegans]|nr:thioesterase-like superfamily-domain-containing protein [Dichotomocladium elegans]